jgi:hypothetical protein
MPDYSYRCECGNEWDKIKKISEREFDDCICGNVGSLQVSVHAKTPRKWEVDNQVQRAARNAKRGPRS